MAYKSKSTWYVSFGPEAGKRGVARATETFRSELEAKQFARAKLAQTKNVSAGTLNPHLPKRTIAQRRCLNGSKNRMKPIWLEKRLDVGSAPPCPRKVAPTPPKTIQTLTIITLPDGLSFAAPVPEPSTWAMIIIGFAGIGFMGLSPLTQKHDGTHGSLIKNST
jgi:hypothetical protein